SSASSTKFKNSRFVGNCKFYRMLTLNHIQMLQKSIIPNRPQENLDFVRAVLLSLTPTPGNVQSSLVYLEKVVAQPLHCWFPLLWSG
ncbi:hypothetical protein, partial [Komagataeibacter swingsii]|uniref:hypothetical protein n=1 Tax=Komagataeibacter swingsii TaxID=215220 RepID=UPI0022312811